MRSVALGFWIGTGGAAERDDEAGLSHLIEHMLFRGTPRYGSQEIDQIFDAMGAELNAGTGKETTSVYSRMLDEHLPRALDVMADMVWRPSFNEDDLDNERADRARGDRDVRGRPAGPRLRRPRRGGVRRPPARPGDHRPRRGRGRDAGRWAARVPRRALRPGRDRRLGGRLGRPRRARRTCPRCRGRALRRGGAGARRAAAEDRAAGALLGQGHRAVPRLPRLAGARARRRAPLRAARARHDPRRDVVVAPVPGGAREARPGLQRLQLPVAVPRDRPGRPVPRHAARQRRARHGRRRRRAGADPRGRRQRRRSSIARERTSRAGSCCRWSRRARG